MAKVGLVPKHVSANLTMDDTFDLIVTLRAAVREFENLPESIPGLLDAFEAAYDGDLPQVAGEAEDGGAAVGA